MLNIVLSFGILFAAFFFGFRFLKETSISEKWALTKLIGYSTLCAALTMGVLSLIVILF